MPTHSLTLVLARARDPGSDTAQIASTLCASCPHTPVGCCNAPPPLEWADLTRISAKDGGVPWLLDRIREGSLVASPRGLALRRTKSRIAPRTGEGVRDTCATKRVAKCVFHGDEGCSVRGAWRPSTCNLYLCETAYSEAEREAGGVYVAHEARAFHGRAVAESKRMNAALAEAVLRVWPEGPTFDAAFFAWLENERATRGSSPESGTSLSSAPAIG